MSDQFLKTAEVARELRVSIQTVRNMVKRGFLPEVVISERIRRYRRSDVDRAIDVRVRAGFQEPSDQ